MVKFNKNLEKDLADAFLPSLQEFGSYENNKDLFAKAESEAAKGKTPKEKIRGYANVLEQSGLEVDEAQIRKVPGLD